MPKPSRSAPVPLRDCIGALPFALLGPHSRRAKKNAHRDDASAVSDSILCLAESHSTRSGDDYQPASVFFFSPSPPKTRRGSDQSVTRAWPSIKFYRTDRPDRRPRLVLQQEHGRVHCTATLEESNASSMPILSVRDFVETRTKCAINLTAQLSFFRRLTAC